MYKIRFVRTIYRLSCTVYIIYSTYGMHDICTVQGIYSDTVYTVQDINDISCMYSI